MTERGAACIVLAAALAAPAVPAAEREVPALSSCLACHAQLEAELSDPVAAWPDDVHAAAGLGCEGCHGGDPAPALAEDPAAMSEEAGFLPAPGRLDVADSCARCHADASYMKRFDPAARVDQLVEYRTSVHGIRNAQGDPVPATCTDCHGSHGIKPVSRPDSPVYPTQVPRTCAACHARAEIMVPYGVSIEPYRDWQRSVHAAALLERGDAAAPACNDCHGNHGAAPPGVDSVARVCGQCHPREAGLFRDSFKSGLFADLGVAECSQCHDHHRVRHPTAELFHGDSAPRTSAGRVTSLEPLTFEIDRLEAGATVELAWRAVLDAHESDDGDRFLHRIEIASAGHPTQELDATVRPGDGPLAPRSGPPGPMAAQLSLEPASGTPVEAGDAIVVTLALRAGAEAVETVRVRDRTGGGLHASRGSVCLECHSKGDACDQATERMYAALQSMERELREAGSLLRRAELWGMEVRGALFELNSHGTTASIEARALVHAFEPDRLVARTDEGREVAAAAAAAGREALAELQYRRKGLAVSLILVLLVLLGLYLKIRDVDRARRFEEVGDA